MQKDWTEDNPFVTILKIRDNAAAATAAATSTAAVSVNVYVVRRAKNKAGTADTL